MERLNIKPQIYPTEIFGKIIEISNGFAKLKLTSKEPIFRGTKQEVDPYFEMEKKEVLAEKKEIVKILQEDREDE